MIDPPHPSGSIGRSVQRVEDRALLAGQAQFLDDLDLPGALHAVFVRSQVAHGTLRHVLVDEASRVPGVVGVFTAADLKDVADLVAPLGGSFSPPRPLLARDRVRFVGEPIAIVVATSPYIGEDAAALVDVDIDPLPPVPSIEASLNGTGPALHDAPGSNGNVLLDRRFEQGDPDGAFAKAAHVIERVIRHPRLTASPMEPRGAAAYVEDGEVTIWCSTQWPHSLQNIVRELFGFEKVRVRCPDIGGGFGLKGVNYPEEILVGWLATQLTQPVKWVEDRIENLIASTHAREMEVRVRAGTDAEGILCALEVDAICDTGAYAVYPFAHILEVGGAVGMAPGPYRVRNYRSRARSVATNKCPSGTYRGVGLPVATLVHERVMDILAAETGIDRAELRRRNMVTAQEMPYISATNQRYDSGDYPAALDAALALIRYDEFEADRLTARAEGRLLGLGLSSYVEWTGSTSKTFAARGMTAISGVDGCHVTLDKNGRADVWTTNPAIGQGTATTYAQIMADSTGIDFSDIRVRQSDTGVSPMRGTGTGASRSANVAAGAIDRAGKELRRRLLEDAAELLEISPDDLLFDASVISVKGLPGLTLHIAELAREADPDRYRVSREFDAEHVLFPYATHACRVSIDPETGRLEILDYVVAEDCGRVVNPVIVEGQTHGAVAQGVGGALYEALLYDDTAQPLTGSFMDYLLPTACEVPAVRIQHLELPVPDSSMGGKGMGEGGTVGAGAAIANAVSDALGVEFNALPLTPEMLHLAAQSRTASPASQ